MPSPYRVDDHSRVSPLALQTTEELFEQRVAPNLVDRRTAAFPSGTTIRFVVDDRQGEAWIADPTSKRVFKSEQIGTYTVAASADTWLAIANGELNGGKALHKGQLRSSAIVGAILHAITLLHPIPVTPETVHFGGSATLLLSLHKLRTYINQPVRFRNR